MRKLFSACSAASCSYRNPIRTSLPPRYPFSKILYGKPKATDARYNDTARIPIRYEILKYVCTVHVGRTARESNSPSALRDASARQRRSHCRRPPQSSYAPAKAAIISPCFAPSQCCLMRLGFLIRARRGRLNEAHAET